MLRNVIQECSSKSSVASTDRRSNRRFYIRTINSIVRTIWTPSFKLCLVRKPDAELPVMRERFTLPCTSAHPCGVYLDVYGAYKVLRSLISGRKEGKFGGGGLLSWLQSTHRGMLISGSDVHGMHFFTKFLACDDIAAIR
nr:PREDICTED: uncharacterized protein LOC105671040 isoform X2 [Linepithema humile]